MLFKNRKKQKFYISPHLDIRGSKMVEEGSLEGRTQNFWSRRKGGLVLRIVAGILVISAAGLYIHDIRKSIHHLYPTKTQEEYQAIINNLIKDEEVDVNGNNQLELSELPMLIEKMGYNIQIPGEFEDLDASQDSRISVVAVGNFSGKDEVSFEGGEYYWHVRSGTIDDAGN